MNALELLGQDLKVLIANPQGLQFLGCGEHIVAASAGPAVTLASKMELLRQAQPARVLTVSAVNDVT